MNKMIAGLIVAMSVFWGGASSFAYFTPVEDVSLDKDWTIEFTKPVDESTLTPASVGILDFNGNKISTDIEVDENDPRIVRVIPSRLYVPGREYVLYVNEDVKSREGLKLDEELAMLFKAKDEPVHICDLDALQSQRWESEGAYSYGMVTPVVVRDNVGYEHMNSIGAVFANESDALEYPVQNAVYSDYYLGGEYSAFWGKLVISGDNRFMEGSGRLNIYIDGELEYTSGRISEGFVPEEIGLVVEGAQRMRIEFEVDKDPVSEGLFFEAYIGSAKLAR